MADPVLGPASLTDKYRVTFIQRLYGQRILNMLWYRPSIIPDPAPDRWSVMGSLANAVSGGASILGLMQAVQTENLTHEAIRVNGYFGDIEARFPFFEIAVNDTGVLPDPAGTANVAVSIEKRATFEAGRPRTGIGRMQVAGPPQGTYTAGQFSVPYLDTVQALANEITESITFLGVTVVPVLINVTEGVTTVNPIFGASAKGTVRDMRRRTVGVGE